MSTEGISNLSKNSVGNYSDVFKSRAAMSLFFFLALRKTPKCFDKRQGKAVFGAARSFSMQRIVPEIKLAQGKPMQAIGYGVGTTW